MDEFQDEFEDLAAAAWDIAENILQSTFLKELRLDIQVEVNLFHPKGLASMMRIVKNVKLKINQIK